MPLRFDNTYARLPGSFHEKTLPTPVPAPKWLAVNRPLGALLGLREDELSSEELLAALAGNRLLEGSEPLALAYAGHQFGGFVPRLGDGRAILLGEVEGTDGVRRDVQLKGSGPTTFSRGGDGRAALGPVLREFLVSEAMHVLGVPTTRSLAAVLTGAPVYREAVLPGAVLTRVAASHIRVGTFEYFAARQDHAALERLVDFALERHYPERLGSETPALTLFDAVLEAQIQLVAKWLAVGFVHGVMNTDNTTISGETIDYGPCAFLDTYHPQRKFSSIDAQGRYAFANQPRIALWNLARFAEALLPLSREGEQSAVQRFEARLGTFASRFDETYAAELRKKLGLRDAHDGDLELAQGFLTLLAEDRVDYTRAFRRLTELSDGGSEERLAELFAQQDRLRAWLTTWRARAALEDLSPDERAQRMRRANPAFIPRNHRVEEAIAAATAGDLGPFERLRHVLAGPFDDQPEHAELADPPGDEQWGYRTFCGT
jgi:uncharacterized protein YdiU (UPF0061 family)